MNYESNDLLGDADNSGFFNTEEDADLFGDAVKMDAPDTLPLSVETAAGPEMKAVESRGPLAKAQSDGYVVLARKYRPQTFDDIVGQHAVQQGLRGAIATGQIGHAYLFSGPRGTGKTSTARILAKALNCQDGGPRPDPCGKCSSCRSITVGSSLDVIEIDAASNTGVDNIRELKSGIVLAPFSRNKVYIVDEVHMLSNQAFNALLKTLEEPPPQVIFVLATTELHKVPETIISRCQTFMFRRFSLEELKGQLGSILDIEIQQRGLSVDPEDRERILDLVSRNAEGGMRDAQVTLDQVLVLSKGKLDFDSVRRFLGMADFEALSRFVQGLYHRKSRELLELIDTLMAEGQDLELFVKGVCEHLRDLLLVNCAGRDTALINVSEDRALELEAAAKSLNPTFMIGTIDHFLKVLGEMKTSGQPRTILELAVLKLTLVDPSAAVENILNRLESLEKGFVSQQVPASGPNIESVKTQSDQRIQSPVSENVKGTNPEPAPLPVIAERPVPAQSYEATTSTSGEKMQMLQDRLRTDNGMLSMSFDKALLGHEIQNQNVTIYIDSTQKLAASQVMRAQSLTTITNVAKAVWGNSYNVKVELREGVAPDVTAPARIQTPPMDLTKTVPATAESGHVSLSEEDLVEEKSGELKIYYPEEIREKTMLEISSSEFEEMMNADAYLKDVVEKTKAVFGIDKSRIKFHRSTLA